MNKTFYQSADEFDYHFQQCAESLENEERIFICFFSRNDIIDSRRLCNKLRIRFIEFSSFDAKINKRPTKIKQL